MADLRKAVCWIVALMGAVMSGVAVYRGICGGTYAGLWDGLLMMAMAAVFYPENCCNKSGG